MSSDSLEAMLDQRSQILLKTLVERYISEGEPVGSRTLSRHAGLDLSAATVRNVMADLEEMGFVTSPHTSAGRVPTPRGYRFFVDTLLTVQPLEEAQVQQLKASLAPDDPQRLISQASHLLSDLSQFAGVVATPRRRHTAFRHLEFLSLSDRRVLLIIVSADGNVQNRILFTERTYSQAELTRGANYINENYAGQTFESVRQKVQDELIKLHSDMSDLMRLALETGSQVIAENDDNYVLSGESNLLHVKDWSSNMASIRRLFDVFEQKKDLLGLLDISQQAQGVQIFIGGESGVLALDECSMVTAAYAVDGQVVGTVGVIGPTRMAYDRVIPIVDITARLLSSALSLKQS